MLLGFDPGKDKCGLAIIEFDRHVLYQAVVASKEAIATIQTLRSQYPISQLVMGDQTTSKYWQQQLKLNLPDLRVVTIDESYSSQEARARYWQIYPAKGWQCLIPEGMRSPPRPIDDIVAIILIERYLKRLVSNHP